MMPKFMSSHTMPTGALRREPVNQLAQAAQNDVVVRPDRRFLNLSEGKGFYIMEAPSKDALAAWFQKVQMPCGYITPVELEAERRVVNEVRAQESPTARRLAKQTAEAGRGRYSGFPGVNVVAGGPGSLAFSFAGQEGTACLH